MSGCSIMFGCDMKFLSFDDNWWRLVFWIWLFLSPIPFLVICKQIPNKPSKINTTNCAFGLIWYTYFYLPNLLFYTLIVVISFTIVNDYICLRIIYNKILAMVHFSYVWNFMFENYCYHVIIHNNYWSTIMVGSSKWLLIYY